MAIEAFAVTRKVYPSGVAAATACAPMFPLAPGLFSTTNDCFVVSVSDCASNRANTSVPPPGEDGTMSLTGLAGHGSSALTVPVAARTGINVPATTTRITQLHTSALAGTPGRACFIGSSTSNHALFHTAKNRRRRRRREGQRGGIPKSQ